MLGSLPTGGTLRPEEDYVAIADGGQLLDDIGRFLIDNGKALLRTDVMARHVTPITVGALLAQGTLALVDVKLGMSAAEITVVSGDVSFTVTVVGGDGAVLGVGTAAATGHQHGQ